MHDIGSQIAALDWMTTGDLAERYKELHGQPCRTRHRSYLIRKIAWRIQANAEGDLSERARRRAAKLANDAESPWQLLSPDIDGPGCTAGQIGSKCFSSYPRAKA